MLYGCHVYEIEPKKPNKLLARLMRKRIGIGKRMSSNILHYEMSIFRTEEIN